MINDSRDECEIFTYMIFTYIILVQKSQDEDVLKEILEQKQDIHFTFRDQIKYSVCKFVKWSATQSRLWVVSCQIDWN